MKRVFAFAAAAKEFPSIGKMMMKVTANAVAAAVKGGNASVPVRVCGILATYTK